MSTGSSSCRAPALPTVASLPRVLRPLVTCCAVVALGLTASCSSAGEGSAPAASSKPSASSQSATATSTPSPSTPSAPVSPANLPHTADGAITFMRFWFDAAEYAYATGDTAPLRTNSDVGCEACNKIISRIENQYASGGSFKGVKATIIDPASPPLEDFGAAISLQVSETAGQRLGVDGTVQGTLASVPPANTTFFATYEDGRWRAFGIARESQ